MPHAPRRAALVKNHKLTTHSTDDGWTHVGRRHHALPTSNAVPSAVALRALLERLTPAQAALYVSLSEYQDKSDLRLHREPKEARGVTVAEVRARYERIAGQWRLSLAREGLGKMVEQRREMLGAVDKGVCLGLGSPSGETGAVHALWQLAAFVDMKGMFAVSGDEMDVELFAQDPVFNSVDVALLRELGISVLPNPKAFARIDSTAFVFAPHYPIAAWSEEMRSGAASLIIGNHVSEGLDHVPESEEVKHIFSRFRSEDGSEWQIPDLQAKKELGAFVQTQSSSAFPLLEEDEHAFTGLRIYWKAESPTD